MRILSACRRRAHPHDPTTVAALVAALVSLPSATYAHPHMFLDGSITFEIQESGLLGFWLEWTFDPMFSAMIVLDMDADKNRALNTTEVRRVEAEAFSNLRNYGYFTHVVAHGEESSPEAVEQFSARIQGDRLIYRFFVPFTVPLASRGATSLSVSVYDDTFFCDCRLSPEAAVAIQAPRGIRATYHVVEDAHTDIQYNPAGGDTSTNLGTRDAARYTGLFHPTRIVLDMERE